MLQSLGSSYPLSGVSNQHLFQEIKSQRIQLVIALSFQLEIHLFVFLVDLIVSCSLEKGLAGQQDVEDDSH
jgi:hypothetical protein